MSVRQPDPNQLRALEQLLEGPDDAQWTPEAERGWLEYELAKAGGRWNVLVVASQEMRT